MKSEKPEFTKEKIIKSDGRYLIFYNFETTSGRNNSLNKNSDPANRAEGEKYV